MGATMARRRINKVQERVLGRKPIPEGSKDKPKKDKKNTKKVEKESEDGSNG